MINMNDNRSYSGLVEKYIGTAYDKVAYVADNLYWILLVAALIEEIGAEDFQDIAKKIAEMSGNIEDLKKELIAHKLDFEALIALVDSKYAHYVEELAKVDIRINAANLRIDANKDYSLINHNEIMHIFGELRHFQQEMDRVEKKFDEIHLDQIVDVVLTAPSEWDELRFHNGIWQNEPPLEYTRDTFTAEMQFDINRLYHPFTQTGPLAVTVAAIPAPIDGVHQKMRVHITDFNSFIFDPVFHFKTPITKNGEYYLDFTYVSAVGITPAFVQVEVENRIAGWGTRPWGNDAWGIVV